MLIPSRQYSVFEKDAVAQLADQLRDDCPIDCDIKVRVQFFQKGRLRQDLDNAVSSICDILQKAGVITDDNSIVEIEALKYGGNDDWSTSILITNPEKH